jgi:two-component system phosphate regulon sensor histidine kinase PhoR
MRSSRLFWKLFLTFAGLNVVAAVCFALVLHWQFVGGLQPASPNEIWGLAATIGLVVLALSYLLVARITRPVSKLTAAAEAIAAGEFERRIYVNSQDELGVLAAAINRMNEDMNRRLQQLQASSGRFATVLGSMLEGVIAVDEQRRVLFANVAAGKMLDFAPDEAVGRGLLETARNQPLDQAAADALAGQPPRQLEIDFGKDGQNVLRISGARLPGDPCPGVVLVLHDLTEMRRLELLRHEFVANVSHELKTPLSSIKAYAETLRNGALDDPANNTRFVERIEEQAERLHQLILDILSLARIEAGQQFFDIAEVAVAPVVAACISDHAPTAAAKQIELTQSASNEIDCVRADAEGLRQILDNLVDNAVNYTPDGGQVTVAWRRQGENCVLEVSDTGIGIDEANQRRLFERFFRVDKARSRELGGTGLGLSIVKHLAQSFGGEVSVTSQPGEGSTFTVVLQLVSGANNSAAEIGGKTSSASK